MSATHQALRRWAKGSYPMEAGVELLIRAGGGRLAAKGWPWVQEGSVAGSWWINVEEVTEENLGALSGGETRLLRIAASLLAGPPVDLYSSIAGLDRENIALVLAAISHAGGAHEHSGPPAPDPVGRYLVGGVRMGFPRLGSLYPWPAEPLADQGERIEPTESSSRRPRPPGAAGSSGVSLEGTGHGAPHSWG
ncbi:MAG: hypothetical protein LCH76_07655 [Actinobacteria bacterium]|nr:hypothetical protein [Actinomycetota bacterium]